MHALNDLNCAGCTPYELALETWTHYRNQIEISMRLTFAYEDCTAGPGAVDAAKSSQMQGCSDEEVRRPVRANVAPGLDISKCLSSAGKVLAEVVYG